VIVGLYANTANSQPGALLAQATIQRPVQGWNAAPIPGLNLTAGKQYWIAVLAPTGSSGSLQYRDQAWGALSITSRQTNLRALPAVWASGTIWQSGKISAYAGS
jgi:hypothetical protein